MSRVTWAYGEALCPSCRLPIDERDVPPAVPASWASRLYAVTQLKWIWLFVLATACVAPPTASPAPTDDPRLAEAQRANAALVKERDGLAAKVESLISQLDEARRPKELLMFNVPFTMPANWVNDVVLPDTFTVHLVFTSTAPVRARIVSLDQYWAFRDGRTIEPAVTYPATTSLDVVFHDTEGCAGYILQWLADRPTTLTPNITITYAPTDHYTGVCAR